MKGLWHILLKEDIHIIGIDRGERNLLYISVVDVHGIYGSSVPLTLLMGMIINRS